MLTCQTNISGTRAGLGWRDADFWFDFRISPRATFEHNRGQCHFRSAAFSSQLERMVGGALERDSTLRVGLGVGGVTIASGSRVRPSHSWTSRLLTSSISLGVSSLFCRTTQCESCRFLNFSFQSLIVPTGSDPHL